MKKSLIALTALIFSMSGAAMAEEAPDRVLLKCFSNGNGVGMAEFIQKSNGESVISVKYGESDEDDAKVYRIQTSLRNIARGTSDTLIAQLVGSNLAYGNALGDAVLVRVLDGQRRAFFAAGGWVHTLDCMK